MSDLPASSPLDDSFGETNSASSEAASSDSLSVDTMSVDMYAPASRPTAAPGFPNWAGWTLGLGAALLAGSLLGMGVISSGSYTPPRLELAAGQGAANAGGLSLVDAAPALPPAGNTPLALLDKAIDVQTPWLDLAPPQEVAPKNINLSDEIPRAQRWQLFFADGGTETSYTQEMDFFKVELGVLTGEGNIEYLSGLSLKAPKRRTANSQEEQRLYMSWFRGNHAETDRNLLSAAGIESMGKIILHFIPPETEELLAQAESAFKNREPGEIQLTRFGVRPSPAGFEFYVLEQVPRE